MCFTKNRLSKPCCGIIVTFLMKYPKSLFVFIVLFSFIAFSTWLLSRGLCSHNSQVIYPLFHTESPVRDISNGSVSVLQTVLQQSSITFLMFYAHWCAQSAKLVYEFHRTSKKFKGQVLFVAINCWTGSCRQQNFLHSYPQLFLHHTNFEPIEYKGRLKFIELVYFVQRSVRPLTYVSTEIILKEFLDQGKPSLLTFINGTNYEDKKYNEFFGAALHTVETVSSLQFGVITSSSIAALLSLKKYGQIVLINSLKSREIYPQELNYNWSSLVHWAEQRKVEYVKELDPDIMEAKTFAAMIKAHPSLILFVPRNTKTANRNILHTYYQVALSYHNCSCSVPEISPNPSEDSSDGFPISLIGKSRDCVGDAYVTSCQSLPVGYVRGMKNSCEVCRECYETCSCAGNSFPLRASVLRGFALPRNSCRSLRRNSYQEKNALSVCCFDSKTSRLRGLLSFGKTAGAVNEPTNTDLNRKEHLKILAERFEKLNKNIDSESSNNNLGMFNKLLGNLMKIFNSPVTQGSKTKLDNGSTDGLSDVGNDSHPPEYQEFGTCEQPGKVSVFAGAGCYSNITLNFYFMDSRKYWNYAQAFGVEPDTFSRVALVLVDSKNEAQYVLSEEIQLNNASIVNFVMKFKHGNLTRRLRSAPVRSQSCFVHGACLTEVVSRTFTKLVLDNDKNVFLMYYTPWCGFCKSVKHVIISLVDHYKHSQHIRIARLNADLNDLPWEFTVDTYPTFIFFPARRKDSSVKFPEYEERSLENFIKFVETHKTNHVAASRKYFTGQSHVRIHSLQRSLNDLKRQNINLRLRLNREIVAKENAEKRRLTAERQVGVILDERNENLFDFKLELQKLSSENAKLLREILSARDQLSKYRKVAERTVEELRRRNWELQSTIVSLEEENVLTKEQTDNSNNKT